MKPSLNPFAYSPAQIAKALIAALTSLVGLLGLAAATFSNGPLGTVGGWATAATLLLIPVLVFLKKAEPWIEMLQNAVPNLPGSESD